MYESETVEGDSSGLWRGEGGETACGEGVQGPCNVRTLDQCVKPEGTFSSGTAVTE